MKQVDNRSPCATLASMEIALAFIIGLAVGIPLGFLVYKKAAADSHNAFKSLSEEALRLQTDQILKLAETKLSGKKDVIDGTLKHMKDDLTKVEQLMVALEKDRSEKYGQLDNRLKSAAEVIKELSDNTQGLKTALSSNNRRGQWGERMAEDVLRLSGLVEGINYIKQAKLESSGSKPDFTFMLPQNLKLNMDVKFPFSNYEKYIEANSDIEKEKYKKEFITDIKNRIREVRSREYINPQDNTVDYMLLFIPNEQIFAFINEIDRSLVDEAMQSKTIMCSPLSLYAILAVIRQSIDNFQFEANSKEMLQVFGVFKQQWLKYKEQMAKVKERFDSVNKEYDHLITTRTNQLDRPLEKIDEMSQGNGFDAKKLAQEKMEEVMKVS